MTADDDQCNVPPPVEQQQDYEPPDVDTGQTNTPAGADPVMWWIWTMVKIAGAAIAAFLVFVVLYTVIHVTVMLLSMNPAAALLVIGGAVLMAVAVVGQFILTFVNALIPG